MRVNEHFELIFNAVLCRMRGFSTASKADYRRDAGWIGFEEKELAFNMTEMLKEKTPSQFEFRGRIYVAGLTESGDDIIGLG
jgi:hypothetical protein